MKHRRRRNIWPGEPLRHARAARKGWGVRRSRYGKSGRRGRHSASIIGRDFGRPVAANYGRRRLRRSRR